MKIGMVTHWYDPEGGAAAGPGTLARALVERGHDVDVVTGFPTYPAGRIFDGYRLRPYQREVMQGVTVHRSPIYPSHDTRAAHRAVNYLSFAAAGSIIAQRALRRSDVVFVYSTPATAAVPALALGLSSRIPMVVQIQDLWPDTVTSSGFIESKASRVVERALNAYCSLVYRRSATVAVTSPGMKEILVSRGVPAEKIVFLPNWADETSFRPRDPSPEITSELGPFRPFTVMYAGNFGELQDLDTVLDTANRLRDNVDIGFVLVGGGVMEQALRRRAAELKLDNVRFVAAQPFSRMSDVLSLGDAQLVSLKDVPLLRSTMPSKLQANLAVAKPVIGSVSGDAADVIRSSGAGVVATPADSEALARAVLQVARLTPLERKEMGQRGRAYYETHFSERVVGDRLAGILASASHGPSNG